MAAISFQVFSPTDPEPELKKPKLDHWDKDEVEKMENLEKKEKNTESKNTCVLKDYERCRTQLMPQDFKDELVVELCKSALAYYQDKHPEECYEFDSVQNGHLWDQRVCQYYLEFCAKNMRTDGNPLQIFKATVYYHHFDGPSVYKVWECVLLKDDVEKMGTKDYLGMPELALQDLKEEEYAKIIELCKLALADYLVMHPEESYEFERVQKVKRWLLNGWEYKLVFCAKNLRAEGNPVATFQAFIYHLVRASDTVKCVLLK